MIFLSRIFLSLLAARVAAKNESNKKLRELLLGFGSFDFVDSFGHPKPLESNLAACPEDDRKMEDKKMGNGGYDFPVPNFPVVP